MNTIRDLWESFEAAVVPPHASEGQRRDMQLAFYGGATAVLSLTATLADMSEDAGVQALETLHEESRMFAAEVTKCRQ